MASINNKLLSLNTKLNVNNQIPKKEIKEVIQEEPKKEQSPAKQETPAGQIEPEKSLENDFLLTYRGITINHVETAETMQISLENFNTIAPKKQQQYKELEEKKAELIEKKDKIKKQYENQLPFIMANSLFDEAFNNSLEQLNTTNYKNADAILFAGLDSNLLNITADSAASLQDKISSALDSAMEGYAQLYDIDKDSNEFKTIYTNAKNLVLSSLTNDTSCNLNEITLSFEEALFETTNKYYYNIENKEQDLDVSSKFVNTRAIDTTENVSGKKEPVVTGPFKGKNGYTFTVTNNTFIRDLGEGYAKKTYTLVGKEGSAVVDITSPSGEKMSIIINVMSYVPSEKIDECINILSSMKGETLKDLADEGCKIQIGKIPFGGESTSGKYSPSENTIYLSYDEKIRDYSYPNKPRNCVKEETLIHELGHAIDFKPGYAQGEMSKAKDLFDKIKGSSQKFYAYTDYSEFFAEYYTYKQLGGSCNGAGTLFRKLESSSDKNVKDILSIMNKIIEDTRALPVEKRDPFKAREKKNEEKPENDLNNIVPSPHNPPVKPTPDIIVIGDGSNPKPFEKPETEDGPDLKPHLNPKEQQEKPEIEDGNTTHGKKPSKEPDAKPDPSTEPDKGTPGSDPESNTVENGKETYNPPEKNPGQEGIGNLPSMDSETISKQKAQELYEKYGDGYDIKVDVVKNADGSFTVEYSVTKSGQGANGNGSGSSSGSGTNAGNSGNGNGIGNNNNGSGSGNTGGNSIGGGSASGAGGNSGHNNGGSYGGSSGAGGYNPNIPITGGPTGNIGDQLTPGISTGGHFNYRQWAENNPLPDGPTGNIADQVSPGKAPGLDENGHIPVSNMQNGSSGGGSGSSGGGINAWGVNKDPGSMIDRDKSLNDYHNMIDAQHAARSQRNVEKLIEGLEVYHINCGGGGVVTGPNIDFETYNGMSIDLKPSSDDSVPDIVLYEKDPKAEEYKKAQDLRNQIKNKAFRL